MNNFKGARLAMAEALVRHILPWSDGFFATCNERQVPVDGAVHQALLDWVGEVPAVSEKKPVPELTLLLPNPSDCPQGQEEHWLDLIKHDLEILSNARRQYVRTDDAISTERIDASIEAYLEARCELMERLNARSDSDRAG